MLYAPSRRDPAWDRWPVRFEDGGTLVVHDPRRLGGVTARPGRLRARTRRHDHHPSQLAAALRDSRCPLKARLLDQSRVAGIGNLIADELLVAVGLSPLRPSDSLTPNEVRRLHRHLGRTLADLTGRGGSHTGRPDGGAPPRRPLPAGRNRAEPVHGGRPHLVVVSRHQR